MLMVTCQSRKRLQIIPTPRDRETQRKREMKKAELVFFPSVGIGHLVSTVELAKHLINLEDHFSIAILIMTAPSDTIPRSYTESVSSSFSSIRFIELPKVDPVPQDIASFSLFIECHKPHVKHAISKLINSSESNPDSLPIAGLVVDMFTTMAIDIAQEFAIPTYLYFTSGAAVLGLFLYFPTLHTEFTADLIDYKGELEIPSFMNSVHPLVLPNFICKRKGAGYDWLLNMARKFRETKGIIVNSFIELETHAINSFENGSNPPVYPVGPLLDHKGQTQSESNRAHFEKITKWLDDQPTSSVIFLCFGSKGSFGKPQVQEIAIGLERSGYRFLWSLRRPPTSEFDAPSDYTNLEEVLPDGFLERTEGRGLMCAWAPQVSILAHKAIGGFVSHCGWNSILESLWFGVPILGWPLYAEQKLNAFELVRDLGLAVEINSDKIYSGDVIMAEEVERGVRCVMDSDSEVRRKVKEMREKSRKTLMDGGGSSTASLERLIEDLKENLQ